MRLRFRVWNEANTPHARLSVRLPHQSGHGIKRKGKEERRKERSRKAEMFPRAVCSDRLLRARVSGYQEKKNKVKQRQKKEIEKKGN